LAIITRRFTARQGDDLVVLLVPQGQVFEHLLDHRRVAWLAEQAAAEADRVPHRLESIGRELLRHQADQAARGAVVGANVEAIHLHAALRGRDDAADDADQRGLARAIGAQQREDLAALDVQIHALEGLEARCVGLGQTLDLNDVGHGCGDGPMVD